MTLTVRIVGKLYSKWAANWKTLAPCGTAIHHAKMKLLPLPPSNHPPLGTTAEGRAPIIYVMPAALANFLNLTLALIWLLALTFHSAQEPMLCQWVRVMDIAEMRSSCPGAQWPIHAKYRSSKKGGDCTLLRQISAYLQGQLVHTDAIETTNVHKLFRLLQGTVSQSVPSADLLLSRVI